MSDKPTYLGLLNAIALGEGRGYELLARWAEATEDARVREAVLFVAGREREHSDSFTARLKELGFGVLDRPDPKHEERMAVAGSADVSDAEKLERLGFAEEDAGDFLGQLFTDKSIDPDTGALLGRYIAEERDSLRRLRALHQELIPA